MRHPWQTTFIPGEDCLTRMRATIDATEIVLSADPPADENPTPAVDWEPGPYGTEAS